MLRSSLATIFNTFKRRRGPAPLSRNPFCRYRHLLQTSPDLMYGLIGKMLAAPGKRDDLIDVLLSGVSGMPGCLSYVVARDTEDEDALWVSEVWESKEAHEASLSLDSVRDAISKGRPMIAGFGERFETEPVGGHGLAAA